MAEEQVKHVVMFKFKTDTSEEKKAELIEGYKALPGKIDFMQHYEWGEDISIEGLSKGFTHCFITTFPNTDARDAYIPHEAHDAYVEVLFPHLDEILVVDFKPNVVK